MKETAIKLGNKIKSLRTALGISQEELAFKAGISTTYLGQVERAAKCPTVEILDKLASALNVSISELFRFDDPVSENENTATLNKITAYLTAMSESERHDILKLIRIFKKFQDNE